MQIGTITTDSLAHSILRAPSAMVLIIQNKEIIVFSMEEL